MLFGAKIDSIKSQAWKVYLFQRNIPELLHKGSAPPPPKKKALTMFPKNN